MNAKSAPPLLDLPGVIRTAPAKCKGIIYRLILVIRSHVSISAGIEEDQLALCTRHVQASAVFLRVFLIVILFNITSKIMCVCVLIVVEADISIYVCVYGRGGGGCEVN